MLRRDYLLRLIEDMGRIAARIRELLVRGSGADVETELQAGARLAGLEMAAIRALTADTLLVLLRPTQESDPGRVMVVAQLLELDAERARVAGDEQEAEQKMAKANRLRAALL
jgi:hypothetical protein